ncbi:MULTISPECIES: hypothetical protein [unclassified Sphingomonas]|uniref:hypothetical protein n=1 Tax=unclassified Sphingomonas TaxID=196159 RepID=UPI002150D605|nr:MULTISPECIES: hypothetical protein [unclassified Sphingomonas]MCR5869589.1 hypothetical protein [Sphingomonas sp. J344]UUX98693.1 hypothetical protein LRS08_14310 [Sphingomonas sp. J315]
MPRKLMMLAAALASAASLPVLARQAATPAAPARAALPVEAFADMPNIEDPELSPGGKFIAAKITVDGTQYFAVMAPEAGAKPRLFRAGEIEVNWWRWVNDDWLVIGVGQGETEKRGSWYVTRAVAYQPSTGKIIHLTADGSTADGDNVIWVSADGPP